MTTRLLTAVCIVLATLTPEHLYGQATVCRPSATELLEIGKKLRAEHSDLNAFIIALDRAIGIDTARASRGEDGSIDLAPYTSDIGIRVSYPPVLFRFLVMEAIRRREPVESVVVPNAVTVSVSVLRLGAPNIERVLVERNTKPVAAITGALRPTTQRSALGASVVLNEGTLAFPCSAFAPGATVNVVAIPTSGANFERQFTQRELSRITGLTYTAAQAMVSGDLEGLTTADISAVLGDPAEIAGARLAYKQGDVTAFRLYVTDGVVTSANPPAWDLAAMKKARTQK